MAIAMRAFRTALLGGLAAFVLASIAGTAAAQSAKSHVMQVRLPGGATAEIHYVGDVPPRVVVNAEPTSLAAFDPFPSFFGPGSPFVAMQRISAEMDRQMAAMLARAESLTAQARSGSPQVIEAALGKLPTGSQHYSFVSTMSGNGVCTRSVQITSQGNGAPPKVVSHSSGNCGPAVGPDASGTLNLPVARPPVQDKEPGLILTMVRDPQAAAPRKIADRPR